jgi:hypothetical protein
LNQWKGENRFRLRPILGREGFVGNSCLWQTQKKVVNVRYESQASNAVWTVKVLKVEVLFFQSTVQLFLEKVLFGL